MKQRQKDRTVHVLESEAGTQSEDATTDDSDEKVELEDVDLS